MSGSVAAVEADLLHEACFMGLGGPVGQQQGSGAVPNGGAAQRSR